MCRYERCLMCAVHHPTARSTPSHCRLERLTIGTVGIEEGVNWNQRWRRYLMARYIHRKTKNVEYSFKKSLRAYFMRAERWKKYYFTRKIYNPTFFFCREIYSFRSYRYSDWLHVGHNRKIYNTLSAKYANKNHLFLILHICKYQRLYLIRINS